MKLGFSKPLIARLAIVAKSHGTTLEQELLASGIASQDHYYEAMARHLKLPFLDRIDPDDLCEPDSLDSQLTNPQLVRIHRRSSAPYLAFVPKAGQLQHVETLANWKPRPNLAVTSQDVIRSAVWKRGARRRVLTAANGLSDRFPDLSAKTVFWGEQGFVSGAALVLLAGLLVFHPETSLFWVHAVLSCIYLLSLVVRMAALMAPGKLKQPTARQLSSSREELLPVYTVMVALYREKAVASQLIASLGKLNWPKSCLDIKLVCEEDDLETIAALEACNPGPEIENVRVPAMQPRTKPKALNYALPAARGAFLVIYDAEDRPHPDQLREAWARFQTAPDRLACLQAPLDIANASASWISALFALEYAGQFRKILPFLARFQLPIPLGGTSNHFRLSVLRDCCGWDPFNVTEDADLGVRLSRMGYRCEILHCATLEDAPEDMTAWRAQRSRWFKGWMQTWLVHLRQPAKLVRQAGFLPTLAFMMTIGGGLLASLAHPLILLLVLQSAPRILSGHDPDFASRFLFGLDCLNLFASYGVFAALGLTSTARHRLSVKPADLVRIPFYWMLLSYAAWKAALELYRNPFFWHKTTHFEKRAETVSSPAASGKATANTRSPRRSLWRRPGLFRW